MATSKLVKELDIQSEEELKELMSRMTSDNAKLAARLVIFKDMTYKEAGDKAKMSTQHVYDTLLRILSRKNRRKVNG